MKCNMMIVMLHVLMTLLVELLCVAWRLAFFEVLALLHSEMIESILVCRYKIRDYHQGYSVAQR